jgi:hypothetical protein
MSSRSRGNGGTRGRGSRGSAPRGGGHRGRGGSHAPASVRHAPRGICDFFWSTGICRRGFECTFRHQSKPNVVEPSDSTPLPDPEFFSADGLAENNHSARHENNTLRPSEAHNHLQELLKDSFAFESSLKVGGFVRIFASINGRNKAWVQ